MIRKLTIALVVMAALTITAASTLAAAPKFFAVSSSINNDGELVVNFDERGLGNDNVDYTLSADATAVWACINGGGKHPQAANKESVSSPVVANGSFEPKNGRVIASLKAGPPSAGGFTCPSGQRLVLASVSYSNIVLSDDTNGVSTSAPDASRTFFTF
jgi:hypothetical protein